MLYAGKTLSKALELLNREQTYNFFLTHTSCNYFMLPLPTCLFLPSSLSPNALLSGPHLSFCGIILHLLTIYESLIPTTHDCSADIYADIIILILDVR